MLSARYSVSGAGNQIRGDMVNTKPYGRICVCNQGQDPGVIVGQIVPDLGDMRADQVGIVQQPLGGV